ncbi:polyprotein [Acetobacter tropicalis]|uniref:Relaxase/primase-like fusion protein n=1 Tax=Acetobacter tropicalis TaxID=104102 RepID=A0A094YW49_9PROT|nr:TraI/MobA(P) family conjugative relaxase [Acetobacter tropicalis]KAA8387279.1 polyprotein [Acetobacter tropicalis]KAA8391049.1 polyprotein [Acetobacter tropicalis]KGB24879.1 relaxase/primase-like fusion protein [Acetobacter tropicalis]MBC9009728.1 relaxase/mobilization nuclease domain-containing protein [Acetobacter tropicalis]MDO8172515.1 TraI/MobA(P) family conjugative relaxase [Acetobacter tropicalis]
MIIKKIKNPKKSTSKSERIRRLILYVVSPEKTDTSEKCIYFGARGFLTDLLNSQIGEMIALATDSVRSADTVNHYVLSWKRGESPTTKQVDEAVTLLQKEMGLEQHQIVYGLHADTDNRHLHVVVNRVDPETLRCTEINRGFDIEAGHRAIALIEHRQGWAHEKNGLYQVGAHGKLVRCDRHRDRAAPVKGDGKKAERKTGKRSVRDVAIEEAVPVIKEATCWADVHEGLAQKGIRYRRHGNGAVIMIGGSAVKASQADRQISFIKLQLRLGPYEEPDQAADIPADGTLTIPLQVRPNDVDLSDYHQERKNYEAARTKALSDLIRQHANQRTSLKEMQRRERETVLKGKWRRRGVALNALRHALAEEHRTALHLLQDQQKEERLANRERLPPFPTIEEWLKANRDPFLAALWAHPNYFMRLEGHGTRSDSERRVYSIPGFRSIVRGAYVHYCKLTDPEHIAFSDRGDRIDVCDTTDRAIILASLQLAASRWDEVKITGSDDFKACVVDLAVEHGFRLKNEDLRQTVEKRRKEAEELKIVEQKQREEKATQSSSANQSLPHKPSKGFER